MNMNTVNYKQNYLFAHDINTCLMNMNTVNYKRIFYLDNSSCNLHIHVIRLKLKENQLLPENQYEVHFFLYQYQSLFLLDVLYRYFHVLLFIIILFRRSLSLLSCLALYRFSFQTFFIIIFMSCSLTLFFLRLSYSLS